MIYLRSAYLVYFIYLCVILWLSVKYTIIVLTSHLLFGLRLPFLCPYLERWIVPQTGFATTVLIRVQAVCNLLRKFNGPVMRWLETVLYRNSGPLRISALPEYLCTWFIFLGISYHTQNIFVLFYSSFHHNNTVNFLTIFICVKASFDGAPLWLTIR